jgi:replication factor C subunit 1
VAKKPTVNAIATSATTTVATPLPRDKAVHRNDECDGLIDSDDNEPTTAVSSRKKLGKKAVPIVRAALPPSPVTAVASTTSMVLLHDGNSPAAIATTSTTAIATATSSSTTSGTTTIAAAAAVREAVDTPKKADKRLAAETEAVVTTVKKQRVVSAGAYFNSESTAVECASPAATATAAAACAVAVDVVAPTVTTTASSPVKKRSLPDTVLPLQSSSPAPKKHATASTVPAALSAGSSTPALLYFQDKKIAVSGIFQRMSREELEQFIQEQGGKISSAVSGKTSFLVLGHALEDGREATTGSKYRTAVEKKVKVLREDEFFAAYDVDSAPTSFAATDNNNDNIHNNRGHSPLSPSLTLSSPPLSALPGQQPQQRQVLYAMSSDTSLWVDRYKPQTPSELLAVGEQTKKLADWLRCWRAVHIAKTQKPLITKDNFAGRAVLLSGPPGIGKCEW